MSLQYQDFLLEEFRARRSRNAQYSLRAFARDLGMPASKLSQNLRGLCGISVAKAETIADKLRMAGEERQLFLALVEGQHARSRVAREQARLTLNALLRDKLTAVSLEEFAIMRDWYHLAILELATLQDFKSDVAWVAEKLGLEVSVVASAFERMKHIGILKEQDGKLIPVTEDREIAPNIPSRTIREHHKQILAKAIEVIESTPMDKREYSSQTFAVDKQFLPELKELVQKFQRNLARLSRRGTPNAVYVMAMQLFPLAEVDE